MPPSLIEIADRAAPRRHQTAVAAVVAAAIAAALVLSVVIGRTSYALGVAVAPPLVWALLRRPQRGVLLLVAIAPFDGLLDLLPHSSTLHAWKEVLVFAVLAATFVAPGEARRPPGLRAPGWVGAVGALVVLGVLSIGFAGVHQGTTGLRIDFFYVLLGLAVWRCPPNGRERQRLITILMVDAFVAALMGVADEGLGASRLHSIGFAYNSTIRFVGGGLLRAFGPFTYQSPLAYFLATVLLIGVAQYLADRHRRRNQLFILSTPVLLAGLVFTFERGAWIGLAVGLLYLGLRRHREILLAVPLVAIVPLYLPAKFLSSATSSTSLGERTSGWSENIHQVVLHPLGVGIGATGAAAEKLASTATSATVAALGLPSNVYQPDNYYFQTLYELGVIGLWFLLLFLVGAIRATDRAAVSLVGPDRALVHSICAFLLMAAVSSTVSTFFEIFPMDLLTCLLLSVAATCPAE